MSTQMQVRGGTTAENLLFTGAQREITVDTDKNTLIVHDGVTAGGFPIATEAQVADGTYFYVDDTPGGSVANSYILSPQSNTNQPNSYMNGILLGFVTANANTGPSSANFQGLGVKNIKYPGGIDPAPGDIFGRVTMIYDASSDWLELQQKPTSAQAQIRSVTGVVSGNALTVTLAPSILDFRSPTLNNGAVNRRVTVGTTQLIVPAGATLGTTNGVQSTIVIVAIDTGSAVELAVVNFDGVTSLDETGLINTVAISGGSSSASTFYSQTARLGVPYRVVGFVQSTQAAAGTWTTTPSKVQGQGGQNILVKPTGIGNGQTWQNVTASRALGTIYTNTTGRTIAVEVSVTYTGGAADLTASVGGGAVKISGSGTAAVPRINSSVIVPPGAAYLFAVSGGTGALNIWSELR